MRRLASIGATSALLAGGLVAALPSTASAAICSYETTTYSTPYQGRKVWIPTNEFSDWKKGGSITRTESEGETTARTTGSSHSIGADGKVGGKIGPVGVEVTVKYNYTHSKSTTRTTSKTDAWSYSFKVPRDALYRARAYKLGWVFKFKRTDHYTGGTTCGPRVTWRFAAAPVKRNSGTFYWALEKKANAGKLRYDDL